MIQVSKHWCTLIILGFIAFIGLDWLAQLAIEFSNSESFKLEGLVEQVTAWSLSIIAIAFGLIGIGVTVFWVIEPWLPESICLIRLRNESHYPRLSFWNWVGLWLDSFIVLAALMGIHTFDLYLVITPLVKIVAWIGLLTIVNWMLLGYLLIVSLYNKSNFLKD